MKHSPTHPRVITIITNSPMLPGVYRMSNVDGRVLYVGKAKNLHSRLLSYVRDGLLLRTATMMSEAHNVEYVVTKTEKEALLLESKMIKTLKPKYNILLRDDKSFPYLKISLDHKYPQVAKYRGKTFDKSAKYFGPFASTQYLNAAIKEITKIFKLRTCTDNYFNTRKRPCIQYQIQRCSAPCVGKILIEQYHESVNQAIGLLAGCSTEIIKALKQKMQNYSTTMHYEKAAEVRDTILAIEHLKQKNDLVLSNITDADVVAVVIQESYCIVQVFIFRNGQFLGNKNYFPENTEGISHSEGLETFISRFYENNTPPSEILLSHKLEDATCVEFIENLHNVKITVDIPYKGHKAEVVKYVLYNAEVTLTDHIRSKSKARSKLAKVQKLFEIDVLPNRIEVYDNSHIMGSFAVGVMIVLTEGEFNPSEYRRYNIKSNLGKFGGDDYQMLREVLTHRMRKAERTGIIPHLMIIDGGKGHLKAAEDIVRSYTIGAKIHIVGMAKGPNRNKGEEQFFIKGKEPFSMDNSTEVMKFLQVARDEAHNFAIRSHRSMRDKV